MDSVVLVVVRLVPQVSGYSPAPSANIPGAGSLMELVNTVGYWGLIFAILGLILSAAIFAVGRTAGNSLVAFGGIAGLVTSGIAAAFIGGAAIWVNHLVTFGAGWH